MAKAGIDSMKKYKKISMHKLLVEAVFIVIAIIICVVDNYTDLGLDQTGIIVVAGLFGPIAGVIAVFLSHITMALLTKESFALASACSTQLIVVITSYLVRRGSLKSRRKGAVLFLIIAFVKCMGYAMGNLVDSLSSGIISPDWILDPYLPLYGLALTIPVIILYVLVRKIPDILLLYVPNLHVYIKNEKFRRIAGEQEIQSRKRSIGIKLSFVIGAVATVMTISAIILFNTLYFRPEMLKANDRKPRFDPRYRVADTVPALPDSGEDEEASEENESDIIIDQNLFNIRDDKIQLSGWDTSQGVAKNFAFFLKFILGLVYVEVAEIAVAIAYANRVITRPVEAIAFAMNTYAGGSEEERAECAKYVHEINIRTGDELEGLYTSFEKMVDDFTDYVERLKKENELERDLEVERASNVAKSAFLSNMSHELRTPINAVLGMDEMILRENNDENINMYAEDIRTAGKTLLSLINDILDFSKIEAGKMEIIPVDYELASLINDLINMVKTRADDKGLKLMVSVNESMPHLLHGDEIRIKQIITNILTNAVKYTEKGSITVTMDYEKTGDDEIELFVSVKDTGAGIKEEDLSKLFVAFERIEEKKNRTIEGTGLGMNITQSLLSMMGSHLEVESVYGEGSDFHFKILQGVVSDEPIGNIEEAYKKSLAAREKYRESFRAPEAEILVVDDTEMNLTVIKNLLKQTEVRVDTALSGFECLDKIMEKKYDLIFLDHRMPEMDGMETFEKMRETDSLCKDAPVIALTANAVSGARELYLEAGFTDYLTKPVDSGKLEKMIRDNLPEEKVIICDVEENVPDEASDKLPEWLKDTEGLDVKKGVMNCGSEDDYLTALKLFYDNIENNLEEIQKFHDSGDRNNYNIKVHALKSSAGLIGASELSELARTLEAASDEGSCDEDYIREKTPELLDDYRKYLNILAAFKDEEEDDSDKPAIDKAGLKDAYDSLMELIGVADFDSSAMIIDSLNGYRMPDKGEKERFSSIKKAAGKFDWDKVVEEIKNGE